MGKEFLSYEEQFKEVLNNEEIDRIENTELREIRIKYWHLQRDVFLDEKNISDHELNNVSKELKRKEMEEIQRFRTNKWASVWKIEEVHALEMTSEQQYWSLNGSFEALYRIINYIDTGEVSNLSELYDNSKREDDWIFEHVI